MLRQTVALGLMAERLEGLGVMGLGWQGSGCRDEC